MTIQVTNPAHGKSKAALQSALNEKPGAVGFYNPSMFLPFDEKAHFSGNDIRPDATGFAVVMDHPARTRFAMVSRRADGTFKVS